MVAIACLLCFLLWPLRFSLSLSVFSPLVSSSWVRIRLSARPVFRGFPSFDGSLTMAAGDQPVTGAAAAAAAAAVYYYHTTATSPSQLTRFVRPPPAGCYYHSSLVLRPFLRRQQDYSMFSANENLQLRQTKRRIVQWIEATMDEEALDEGVNVMVMQVSCKAPGCVPLETAIIIIFPKSSSAGEGRELIPGLPESRSGGSYKTKILKPMKEVTQQDVLEALPPQFKGGLRTMERLCLQARDVMLAQITQLFGGGFEEGEEGDAEGVRDGDDDDDDVEGRRLMAQYLQRSLQEYMNGGCKAPEWGKPFPESDAATTAMDTETAGAGADGNDAGNRGVSVPNEPQQQQHDEGVSAEAGSLPQTGNLVIRRPVDDVVDGNNNTNSAGTVAPSTTAVVANNTNANSTINSAASRRKQRATDRRIAETTGGGSAQLLSRLADHAPGIRRQGCPCCDPDHPNNVVDQMLLL